MKKRIVPAVMVVMREEPDITFAHTHVSMQLAYRHLMLLCVSRMALFGELAGIVTLETDHRYRLQRESIKWQGGESSPLTEKQRIISHIEN